MYQSSSISMMIIGLGVLISLYVGIDSVFALSNQYEVLVQGINVVLLLGLAKVIDGTGGINNLILGYSKLFRWSFILVLVLGITNVMLNLYLIPILGIEGAALSTLLSITLFNILQCIIIRLAFRIQPFSLNHIWVLAIAIIAYFLGKVIPDTGFTLLNILLKSGVTLSVFAGLVLYFNFSPDINSMVHAIIDRGRKFVRK